MQYQVATTFYHPIFDETGGPFVSIFFETSPTVQNLSKNQIKLKNAISTIKDANDSTSPFVEQLETLIEDITFWNQIKRGLGILMSPTQNVIYFSAEPFLTSTIISDQPYILPLIRHFQQLTEVELLLVNRDLFKVYRGTYRHLSQVPFPNDKPTLAKDVLGTEESQRYFGTTPTNIMHGGSDKSYEDNIDLIKYFKYVDNYVHENFSKVSKLPLILVALPEYHADFRKISENPYLFEEGIKIDFARFSTKVLGQQLEALMTPHHRRLVAQWRDQFRTAQANGKGSDFIEDIMAAVLDNSVDTLFIRRKAELLGSLDIENHTYQLDKSGHDLLNESALMALKAKANVLVLDEDEMPTNQVVAAIMRY